MLHKVPTTNFLPPFKKLQYTYIQIYREQIFTGMNFRLE